MWLQKILIYTKDNEQMIPSCFVSSHLFHFQCLLPFLTCTTGAHWSKNYVFLQDLWLQDFWCHFNDISCENPIEQREHWKGFIFRCTKLTWPTYSLCRTNRFLQYSHSNFFGLSFQCDAVRHGWPRGVNNLLSKKVETGKEINLTTLDPLQVTVHWQ